MQRHLLPASTVSSPPGFGCQLKFWLTLAVVAWGSACAPLPCDLDGDGLCPPLDCNDANPEAQDCTSTPPPTGAPTETPTALPTDAPTDGPTSPTSGASTTDPGALATHAAGICAGGLDSTFRGGSMATGGAGSGGMGAAGRRTGTMGAVGRGVEGPWAADGCRVCGGGRH